MLDAAWVAYVAVLGVLAVYGAHRLVLTAIVVRLGVRARRRGPREPRPDAVPAAAAAVRDPDGLPAVTVQLPLYNERYVAERLIAAAAALDWPRDRLEIQVLDDSTDDTSALCARQVQALRARGVDIHHVRRGDRAGFKAGALQAGLASARGDLVLILDADFLPPPDLLRATVGHFDDPGVGMVQVRWDHLNRDAGALTRVQALLLDGHFAIEQVARSRAGWFFNFNGTAGIWRRDAIASAGGWQGDTLTEDLDLSYRALLAGWRFVYVPARAAPAELPADMNAFKSQQFRWAKGSVQVLRKLLPAVLRAPVTRRVKVEALFHLTQNVPYLFTLLLVLLAVPALVLRPGSAADTWRVHVPTLVGTALTLGAYVVVSQRALGRSAAAALLRLPALVAVTAGICVSQARAVVEGLVGYRSPFVRTPKDGDRLSVGRDPAPAGRGPTPAAMGEGREGVGTGDAGTGDDAGTGCAPAAPRRLRARWRRPSGYRGLRDLTPIAELALSAFFAAFAVYAADAARWSALPLLAVLAAGFGYVGVRSALHR